MALVYCEIKRSLMINGVPLHFDNDDQVCEVQDAAVLEILLQSPEYRLYESGPVVEEVAEDRTEQENSDPKAETAVPDAGSMPEDRDSPEDVPDEVS